MALTFLRVSPACIDEALLLVASEMPTMPMMREAVKAAWNKRLLRSKAIGPGARSSLFLPRLFSTYVILSLGVKKELTITALALTAR